MFGVDINLKTLLVIVNVNLHTHSLCDVLILSTSSQQFQT